MVRNAVGCVCAVALIGNVIGAIVHLDHILGCVYTDGKRLANHIVKCVILAFKGGLFCKGRIDHIFKAGIDGVGLLQQSIIVVFYLIGNRCLFPLCHKGHSLAYRRKDLAVSIDAVLCCLPAGEYISFTGGCIVNGGGVAPGMHLIIDRIIRCTGIRIQGDNISVGYQRYGKRIAGLATDCIEVGVGAVNDRNGKFHHRFIGNMGLIVIEVTVELLVPNSLCIGAAVLAVSTDQHIEATVFMLRDHLVGIITASFGVPDLGQYRIGTEGCTDLRCIYFHILQVAFRLEGKLAVYEGFPRLLLRINCQVIIGFIGVCRCGAVLVSRCIVGNDHFDAVVLHGIQALKLIGSGNTHITVPGNGNIDDLQVVHCIGSDLLQDDHCLCCPVDLPNGKGLAVANIGAIYSDLAFQRLIPQCIQGNIACEQFPILCLCGIVAVGILIPPAQEGMACHGGLILIKIGNIVLVFRNGRACSLDLAALSLEGHIVSFQGNGCIQDALLGLAVKVCALQAAAQLAVGNIAHGCGEVLVGICNITHGFLGRSNGAVLINKGADHNAVIVRNGLTGFVDPNRERASVAGLTGDGNTDTGVATGMLCNDLPGTAGCIVVQNLYNSCLRIKGLRHILIHLYFKSDLFAFRGKFQIYIDHPITICLLSGSYGAVVAGLGNSHKVFLACGKASEGGCCVLFKSGLGNIRGACCGIVIHFFAIHKQLVSGVRGFTDRQIAVGHFQVGGIFIVSCHKGYKNIILTIVIAVGKPSAVGICICVVNGNINVDAGFFLPYGHQCNGGCNGLRNGSAGSNHTAAVCPAQEYIACAGRNSIYRCHLCAAGKVFRCRCLAAGECAAFGIIGHAIVMHVYAAGSVGHHQAVFIDLMETGVFLVVNMVNTVFYAHTVSTGAGVGQINIHFAAFFPDKQSNIFTVDICNIYLVAVQIGVDGSGVNRLGGVLHICVSIFYNCSVLRGAVGSHHIDGVIRIGGQAGEHDVAILLHTLYAIDVITATRIERALFQG